MNHNLTTVDCIRMEAVIDDSKRLKAMIARKEAKMTRTARLAIVCATLLCHITASYSQDRKRLGPAFCSFDAAELVDDEVTLFEPDDSIMATVTAITKTAGLPQNFAVRAFDRFNAEARIINGRRHLLYNSEFLKRIRASASTEWGATGILAHEIAHHLLGHTVEHNRSNPELELAADKYAGFILSKMGATLDQAQSGFSVISAEVTKPGSTHPPRSQRLKSVEDGWNEGRGGPIPKYLTGFGDTLSEILSNEGANYISIKGKPPNPGDRGTWISRLILPGMEYCWIYNYSSDTGGPGGTGASIGCGTALTSDREVAVKKYREILSALKAALPDTWETEERKEEYFIARKDQLRIEFTLERNSPPYRSSFSIDNCGKTACR